MSPIRVFAVRHGESEWNVLRREHPGEESRYRHPLMYTPDCGMTDKGVQQSRDAGRSLQEILVEQEKKEVRFTLIVSPLRRALQTARHLLSACKCVPSRVLVHKGCAEVMADSCDIGSSPTVLQREFPEFDFASLEEHWWPHGRSVQETWDRMRQRHNKDGRESDSMVAERLGSFRRDVQAMEEDEIAVIVCHSDVIWWLTSQIRQGERFGVYPKNGEILDVTEHMLAADADDSIRN